MMEMIIMMVLCLMNVFFRNVKSLKEGHGQMCLVTAGPWRAWPSSASNNEAPNKPEVDAKKLFFVMRMRDHAM